MIEDKGILIRNIYYMLTYAFRVLRQKNYEDISCEDFDNIQELFAEILCRGISQQLKQGLHREYVSKNEDLSTVRGRIEMKGTIRNVMMQRQKIFCDYDELSVDNDYNRILKTAMLMLIRSGSLSKDRISKLRTVLMFFDEIEIVEHSSIRWDGFRFHRNNRNYEMLINISRFIIEGLILTTDTGNLRMPSFTEDHLHRLYERFILEYYRHHHPHLQADALQIPWDIDDDSMDALGFLPRMQTDITLRYCGKTLIIDAKYYGKTMQSKYDGSHTFHSHNMYQIFTYVKNYDRMSSGDVSGMLLYAKTSEPVTPDSVMNIAGNRFSVKTLDLNRTFSELAAQLDSIVVDHFGIDIEKTSS